MRVLAIGAHPDDVELLCAGTLAKCAKRGDDVYIAIATNGEAGSNKIGRAEMAAIRQEEAKRACEVIGAKLIWMGFQDEFLFNDKETRIRFIDVIREARPDVMFVHGPSDYHPDHRISGQIAIDARIPATLHPVETSLPPCDKIPHIFLMDNIGGFEFEPEAYVDVTDVIDIKAEMLSRHKSQDAHLQEIYGIPYVAWMKEQASMRGKAFRVPYAEGFRSVKTFPVTGGYDLLP